MKEDGSLRLCLDSKDLNKAIKRNQWYARTLDDILPELVQSKYFTINDATSGFWYVLLDLRSSLLTTFNTPWGKCKKRSCLIDEFCFKSYVGKCFINGFNSNDSSAR